MGVEERARAVSGGEMKTHWFTSAEHPEFGKDLVALCGEVVPKAQPVRAIWDSGDQDFGLVTCWQCNRQLGNWLRYVAVIQGGQQALDEERGK